MQMICECGAPLNEEKLTDRLIVHCDYCPAKYVKGEDHALTVIDEIPDTEYLGG